MTLRISLSQLRTILKTEPAPIKYPISFSGGIAKQVNAIINRNNRINIR